MIGFRSKREGPKGTHPPAVSLPLTAPIHPTERHTVMARKTSYVPNATPTKFDIPVDEIPEDVKAECEEAYKNLKENPGGRFRAEFDEVKEVAIFVGQATAYCNQRTVNGVAAPIRFRKSPTKKGSLKDTQLDYRVTDLLTPAEKTTEEIRDAAAAANAAAAATPTAPAATPAKVAKKTAAKAA